MPKYQYYCSNCEKEIEQYHPIATILINCPHCKKDTLSRVYNSNFIIPKNATTQEKKIGEEVKRFIREAKEDLIEQKEEHKNKMKD